MMNPRSAIAVVAIVLAAAGLAAQTPPIVDTSKIGPQVGAVAPAFSGTDQSGKPQSLAAAMGPRGTMLVFFRSADW